MIEYATISRLHDYEACPQRAKLKYDDKIPEPIQPDSPAERGSAIHQAIENYIQKKTDTLPTEALGAEPYATQFREAPPEQPVTVEQMWTFDELWEPLHSKDSGTPYFKCKLDVYQKISDIEAYICDWKAGRKAGNEIKHGDQIRAYIFAALARYEELDAVTCLLRYTDVKEETLITTYRMDVMRHFEAFNARIQKMLSDDTFYPRPSINHCRYCPYKKGPLGKKKNAVQGTGHCDLNPE